MVTGSTSMNTTDETEGSHERREHNEARANIMQVMN